MPNTTNLQLPFMDANQNQKYVTYNDALLALDALVQIQVQSMALTAPPGSPSDGQVWIPASSATGAWSGKDLNLAAWQDGVWTFYPPKAGWIIFNIATGTPFVWNGSSWISLLGLLSTVQLTALGIGTPADLTNPLSVLANNVLLKALTTGGGGTCDIRAKLSKATSANTASVLLQDNLSGRAEVGLTGDDNFHVKTSPDGSTWIDSLVIDKTLGSVDLYEAESTVASATTTDIGAVTTMKVAISGTTTITAFGTGVHKLRLIRFAGALTLTHNPTSLILPGGTNITTAANDCAVATSDGSGNWRVREYVRAANGPDVFPLAGGLISKIRNGTMDVAQRGTGAITVTTSGAYTLDGWIVVPTGASVTAQQAAGRSLTAYSLKMTGAASVTDVVVKQRIESLVAAPLTSQTVTFQAEVFNGTGGSITPTLTVKHPTAADNYASTVTDVSAVSLQACANNAWTRVAYTFTDAGSAALGLEISLDFGNNFSTTGKSIQITECDLRATPGVATGLNGSPPPPELRSIATETALCQRYYYQTVTLAGVGVAITGSGIARYSAGLPVTMRATPTVSLSGNGFFDGATPQTFSSIGANYSNASLIQLDITTSGSAFTVGRAVVMYTAGGDSCKFSAEL